MNEITFWTNHVKPALNSSHFDRVAWKVGTSTRAGIPDVLYRSHSAVAWLELKWLPHWPVRETTPLTLGLSVEQVAHLRDWAHTGQGFSFILLLIEKDVLLFDWAIPNVIQRDNLDEVTLARLPLADVKKRLAKAIDSFIVPPTPGPVKEATWMPLPRQRENDDQ